jgi:hypothetical protein
MATFIYNKGGALFSNQLIYKHLDNLEITKKKASIEAFQALNEDVQFWVFTFWNYPPPLRIFQVPQVKLIGIDEFGVMLERCNRTCSWALKVFHIHKDGHYGHGIRSPCPSPSSWKIQLCPHRFKGVSSILNSGFGAFSQRG